jgi:hypothetical protein
VPKKSKFSNLPDGPNGKKQMKIVNPHKAYQMRKNGQAVSEKKEKVRIKIRPPFNPYKNPKN